MRVLVSSVVLLLAAQALAITLPPNPEFDVRRVIPGNTYQGITFTPSGDLFMTSGLSVCKWPNAAFLPIGGTMSFANATCANSNVASTNIVSSQTGRIYNVNGYEIDPITFQATKRWNDCGASHGIAIDPRDGAVFVSNVGNGQVWRIPNPDTTTGVYQTNCVSDLYFNAGSAGLGGFDAITIGPDGTFYGAGWTNHYLIVIKPWSSSSPQGTLIAAKPTLNANPDGISICVSNGNSFALVAMTGNVISKFNLSGPGGAPAYAESTIATNVGGYLDFTAVDPKGCIWGTTLTINGAAQGVYRVTNADGSCGCASAQVPTSDVCPNCNDITLASYPGSVAFTAQSVSSHHCATIAFSA